MSFTVQTPAFTNGGDIPNRYTCMGENVSPALTWVNPPNGTRSLALIFDDPDAPAGTWTHWLIWNLPVHLGSVLAAVPPKDILDNGTRQGTNDFGRIGYGGPCPPPGKVHRYFLRLYALDSVMSLKAGAARGELETAMKHHVVSQAEWMGRFKR